MIVGRWFISPHAVRQYIDRVHHHLTFEEAREELARVSDVAHYVKDRPSGAQLWRTGKPTRLRLVVGLPEMPGGLPVLVTVLPAHDRMR